jgi:hypothetical protein
MYLLNATTTMPKTLLNEKNGDVRCMSVKSLLEHTNEFWHQIYLIEEKPHANLA